MYTVKKHIFVRSGLTVLQEFAYTFKTSLFQGGFSASFDKKTGFYKPDCSKFLYMCRPLPTSVTNDMGNPG